MQGNPSTLRSALPISALLPVGHANGSPSSRYCCNKAWAKREEGNSLELVIDKLDNDHPLSSGTSRLSAFSSYIGDLHKEALYYDRLARKHLYRKIVMNESRFRKNEDSEMATNLEFE